MTGATVKKGNKCIGLPLWCGYPTRLKSAFPTKKKLLKRSDELFKKYYNVRPSCKDCGETLFSNGRKKEHLLGKRRRADQIGGAKKKQKVDSVTQQDLDDVTRRAGEAAPHGNITDSWMEVMKTWWRKIRRSRN